MNNEIINIENIKYEEIDVLDIIDSISETMILK